MNTETIKIFISYSHKDEELRTQLNNHLTFLTKNNGTTYVWYDRKLTAGTELDPKIKQELNEAHVILLLISSDFISSSYCYDVELKNAMLKHDEGKAVVIPILLRDCVWKDLPFSKLLISPTDAKAITNAKNWASIDEAFTDVALSIQKTINNYKDKLKFNHPIKVDLESPSSESTKSAIELFKLETKKISYKSSKEDLERIEKIRTDLYQEIFGDFDEKIKHEYTGKELYSNVIFNKIYSSELLDNILKQDIHRYREDHKNHKWHDRSIIVTALTLSLLTHKKFDQHKANILLDFLTDFEDKVWQRALVGLVISLLHHKNKWDRFDPLKKRLTTLKSINEVQEGLDNIESILRINLYKNSFFSPKTFEKPFFKQPMNCFLPFYEGNAILEDALDHNETDVDSEKFINYVTNLPFLDSYKYSLCLAMKDGNIQETSTEKNTKLFNALSKALNTSEAYHPYQNILCEYYNFFTYYPENLKIDLFKNQLSIANTKLRDVVVNKTFELKFSAFALMEANEYYEALQKLQELDKIKPNDLQILWNLSVCFQNLDSKDYYAALKCHKQIESITPNDEDNWIQIAVCCRRLKQFDEAYTYLKKSEEKDPLKVKTLAGFSYYYTDLEDYDTALIYELKIEKIEPQNVSNLISAGASYFNKKEKDIHKAIEYMLKVVDIEPENIDALGFLVDFYQELERYQEALTYSFKILRLNKKDHETIHNIGRIYFLGQIDLEKAIHYLNQSVEIRPMDIAFGNLGHIALCQGKEELALENYKKCIKLIGDSTEFEKKYNIDIPYLEKYNLDKKYLETIKKQVLDWYSLS